MILRRLLKPTESWLIESLEENGASGVDRGIVNHSQILGKEPRSVVESTSKQSKKPRYLATHATMEEYIRMCSRSAQPIYYLDANVVAALADVNVDYPQIQQNEEGKYTLTSEPEHFLEAGTGHGSLTLILSRLLHAANGYARLFKDSGLRGAILHSIDHNLGHLNLGKKHVHSFRRGIYKDNVDFYHSLSPSAWLEENPRRLSGCFLDLPEPERYVIDIAKHLKTDAPLVIFQPSITQFIPVIETLKSEQNPYKMFMDKVVELQPGIGAGLREWDLRGAFIRLKFGEDAAQGMVCRPKVGTRVIAGGFVGLFRRMGSTTT